MTEQPSTSLPAEIAARKEQLLVLFAATLPTEHQPTLSVVLIHTGISGEWGDWLRGSIALQYLAQAEPFYTMLRTQFDQAGLSEERMATVTDEDVVYIAQLASDHLLTDGFWDEVRYIVEHRLYEQRKQGKPHNIT